MKEKVLVNQKMFEDLLTTTIKDFIYIASENDLFCNEHDLFCRILFKEEEGKIVVFIEDVRDLYSNRILLEQEDLLELKVAHTLKVYCNLENDGNFLCNVVVFVKNYNVYTFVTDVFPSKNNSD